MIRRAALLATLAVLALAGRTPAAEPPAPQPVTFDEAVAQARARAVTSVVAAQEVRRADGLLIQARSGSLPAVSANGVYNRYDQARVSGGVRILPQATKSANLQATLALSPSRWYQWSHAGDQLEAARAGSAEVQRAAALTAGRAYLTVVAQHRVIDVTRRAVESSRAHFEFARTRREAGVGNTLDELRAEQQLAASAALLEAALTGLARVQEALGQVVGADGPLDAAAEPALAPPAADEGVDSAVGRRADVVAAGARAEVARRVARDSWADWLPTILGSWQFWEQDWHTVSSPGRGWQAQIILSVPLLEGGLRAGQLRERNALEAEGAAVLDAQLRQARSEVRAAWASLQHAEASLRESQRAADRAGKALVLVTDAYRSGATNSLDVTDAEQRARDAETAAAVAEDAVRQARLDLLAATGHFP